jgi:hypothetical protein
MNLLLLRSTEHSGKEVADSRQVAACRTTNSPILLYVRDFNMLHQLLERDRDVTLENGLNDLD